MLRETQERIRRAESRLARETEEEETPGGGLTRKAKSDILEERGNPYHGPDGRFTSGPGGRAATSRSLTNAAGQSIIEVKTNSLYGPPNGITQKKNAKGGVERNYYDSSGKQYKQIANNDHGFPKQHPFGKHGEHAHDYEIGKDGKPIHGLPRELTGKEQEENKDIL